MLFPLLQALTKMLIQSVQAKFYFFVTLSIMLLGISCSKPTETPTPVTPNTPTTPTVPTASALQKIAGDSQYVAINAAAPDSLIVRVTSSNGTIVVGTTVNWSVSGGGTISQSSSISNEKGDAKIAVKMPSSQETFTVTASLSSGVNQIFQVNATTPATLIYVAGNNSTGPANGLVSTIAIVKVLNSNGKAVGGANVQFGTNGEGKWEGGQDIDGKGSFITHVLTKVSASDGTVGAQYRFGKSIGIYAGAARIFVGPTTITVPFRFITNEKHDAWIATLKVGKGPQGVSVNPETNKVFVANNGTWFGCSDVAPGSDSLENTISVIDEVSNQVNTISAGGNSPIYATPNPNTNKIYIATSGSTGVTVLNGKDLLQLGRVDGAGTHQPAINTIKNEIWTNTRTQNGYAVSLINGNTDKLDSYIDLPGGTHGVAVHSGRNEIYLSRVNPPNAGISNGLFLIDGNSKTLQTFTLPSSLAIAVNEYTNRIYVSSGNNGFIHVVDAVSKTLVQSINLGIHAIEMAIDKSRNRIYAASESSPYSLLVLDGSSNTLLFKIPVGGCPFGVAYNPKTDRVYVSNGHDNSVTVLDASKFK